MNTEQTRIAKYVVFILGCLITIRTGSAWAFGAAIVVIAGLMAYDVRDR